MRYEVKFTGFDKEVVKLNKLFKSKKPFNLHDAERMLQDVHQGLSGFRHITFVVTDSSTEMDYIFDDMLIDSEQIKKPNILEIIEDEILNSDLEEPQKLISDIQRAYREETDETQDQGKKERGKSKKKGFSFFKKNRTDNVSEENGSDFAELENEEENIETDNVMDDFAPITNTSGDMEETEFEEVQNVPEEFEVISETDEETNIRFETENSEEPPIEFNLFEEEQQEIDNIEILDFDTKNQEQTFNVAIPENTVKFPAYDDFIKLSEVDNKVKRYKTRFAKDQLMKSVGFNPENINNLPAIDKLKVNYVDSELNNTDFVLVLDMFEQEVQELKINTEEVLIAAYERAMMYNYEEEAKEALEPVINEILLETELKMREQEEELNRELENKLANYTAEQEKALSEFVRQQELDKNNFLNDLENKRNKRIDLDKTILQQDVSARKDSLKQEKVIELKTHFVNELAETKREALRNFDDGLEKIMDHVWTSLNNLLGNLKTNIDQKVPEWKEEIEYQQKLDAERREELRKEEELRIKREELALEQKKLDSSTVQVETNNPTNLETMLDKKMSEFNQHFTNQFLQTQMMQNMNQNNTNTNIEQAPNTSKIESKSMKMLMAGAIIGLFALGGGVMVGKTISDDGGEKVEAKESGPSYEDMYNLISQTKTPSNSTENMDLSSLLSQKKFKEAMNQYTDLDSLNKIEYELYKNNEINTLNQLNKNNETTFGELDAAILSGNAKKAYKAYEKLNKEALNSLSKDRKSELALMFYQIKKDKLANQLLSKTSK